MGLTGRASFRVTTPVATSQQDFSSLRTEVTEVGLMLAIACSIGNAISQGKVCRYAIKDISRFAPEVDGLLRSLQYLEGGNTPIGDAIRRMTSLIDKARSVTAVAAKSDAVELSGTVADCWNRAASVCVVASILLDREHERGPSETLASPPAIRRLLRDACGGASPCIDEDGGVYLPGWAERRSSPRSEINEQVLVSSDGVEFNGTIFNVSTAGMKIETDSPLELGANVTVRGKGGVVVEGLVIWSQGNEAGIESFGPIDPSDFIRI